MRGREQTQPSPVCSIGTESLHSADVRSRRWFAPVGNARGGETSTQKVEAAEPKDVQAVAGDGDQRPHHLPDSNGFKHESTDGTDECSNAALFKEIEQLQRLLGQHLNGDTPSMDSLQQHIHCLNARLHRFPQAKEQTHRVKPLTKEGSAVAGSAAEGGGCTGNLSVQCGLEANELAQDAEPAGRRRDMPKRNSVPMASSVASPDQADQETKPVVERFVRRTPVSGSVTPYVWSGDVLNALDCARGARHAEPSEHSAGDPASQRSRTARTWGRESPKSAAIRLERKVWRHPSSERNEPDVPSGGRGSIGAMLPSVALGQDTRQGGNPVGTLRDTCLNQETKCTPDVPGAMQTPETGIRSVPAASGQSRERVFPTTSRQSGQAGLEKTGPEKTGLEQPGSVCLSSRVHPSDLERERERNQSAPSSGTAGRVSVEDPLQAWQSSKTSTAAPSLSAERAREGKRLTSCAAEALSPASNAMSPPSPGSTSSAAYSVGTQVSADAIGNRRTGRSPEAEESRNSRREVPEAASAACVEEQRSRSEGFRWDLTPRGIQHESARAGLLDCSARVLQADRAADEVPGCLRPRASWIRFRSVRRFGRLKLRRRYRIRAVKNWREHDREEPRQSQDAATVATDPRFREPPRPDSGTGAFRGRPAGLPTTVTPQVEVIVAARTSPAREGETRATASAAAAVAAASLRNAGHAFEPQASARSTTVQAPACREKIRDQNAVKAAEEPPGLGGSEDASQAVERLPHWQNSPASAVPNCTFFEQQSKVARPPRTLHITEAAGFTDLATPAVGRAPDEGQADAGQQAGDGDSLSSGSQRNPSSDGPRKHVRHPNGLFRLRIRRWRTRPLGRHMPAATQRLLKRESVRRHPGVSEGDPAAENREVERTRNVRRRPPPASARRETQAVVVPGSRTAGRAAARAARRRRASSCRPPGDADVWRAISVPSAAKEDPQKSCPDLCAHAAASPLSEAKLSMRPSQQSRGWLAEGVRGLPRHMAERAGQRHAKEKPGKQETKDAEDKKKGGERDRQRRAKAQAPSSDGPGILRGAERSFHGSPLAGPRFEDVREERRERQSVRGGSVEKPDETGAGQRHVRSVTESPSLAPAEKAPRKNSRKAQLTQETGDVNSECPDTASLLSPFEELFGLPDLIPDEWYGDVSKRFEEVRDKTRVRTLSRSAAGDEAGFHPPSPFVEETCQAAVRGEPSPVQELQAMQVQREQLEQRRLEAVHALSSPQGSRRDPAGTHTSPCLSSPQMLDFDFDSADFGACHFPEDLLELIGSVEEYSPSALRGGPCLPPTCKTCRESSSSASSGRFPRSTEGSLSPFSTSSSSSFSASSQEESASSPNDLTPQSRVARRTPPSSSADSEKRRLRMSRKDLSSDSVSEKASLQGEETGDEKWDAEPTQLRLKVRRPSNDERPSSSTSETDDSDLAQSGDSPADSQGPGSLSSSSDDENGDQAPTASPGASIDNLGRMPGRATNSFSDARFHGTALHTEAHARGTFRTLQRNANRLCGVEVDRGKPSAHWRPAGRRRRSRSQPPLSGVPRRRNRAQHSRREACLKQRLLALESVCMSHDEYMNHFARKMRLTGAKNKVACVELTKAKRAFTPHCFLGGGRDSSWKGDGRDEDSGTETGTPSQPPWGGSEDAKAFRCPRHRSYVLTIEAAVSSCLQKRGWMMNRLVNTHFFDLKWKISDVDEDYRCLRREQLFNHFQNNRVMTTKAGLSRSFRLLAVEEQVRTEAFFPRCYDLSTLDDCMDFLVDYSRCEAVTVLMHYLRCCQAPKEEFEAVMLQPAPEPSVRQSSVLLLWMAHHIVSSWLHELEPDYFLDRHDPLGERRRLDPQRLEVFATHAWNVRSQPAAFRRAWHSLAKCADGRSAAGERGAAGSSVTQVLPRDSAWVAGKDAFDGPPSDCSATPSEAQILDVLRGVQKAWLLWRAERGDVDLENLRSSEKPETKDGSAARDAPQEPRWHHHNVWIMKPSSSSKASGVYCLNNPWDILKSGRGLSDRLVQRYIERPLLIFSGRKFDMRQWVLIRSFAPLKVYAFTDLYLRLCSEPYDLRDLHNRFRHISNWNLNRLNSEMQDGRGLGKQAGDPNEDVFPVAPRIFSDCTKPLADLREALERATGTPNFWDRRIKPQIRKLILQTARAARPAIVSRPNCFELYGFDILLDAEYRPWLVEVNLSPACAARAPWHKRMVSSMTRQLVQILVDEPHNSPVNADPCGAPSNKPTWELLFDESVPPSDAARTFPPIEPDFSGTFPEAETCTRAGNPFLQFYSQYSSSIWAPTRERSRQKASRANQSDPPHLPAGGPPYWTSLRTGLHGAAKGRRGPGVPVGGKADLWNKFMVTGERMERQQILELDMRVSVDEAVRRLARWWRKTAWRRRAARRRKVKVLEDIELDVCFGNC
ncbi:putative tubulin-tyrosine ligase family protein [Neospora caninum Liverpool]|nr:putative tubulin-tyrosine ligase family protein [Neospora caninum Liverpool]CBZ50659.1 putative tubulin-tyrosine ligase family protein [Neospora caninum Liverpool]|eukprot:XP_003880692.1 putative tubulin-tyrosine ligase family protein [Neospora caninum Liverpool]